MNVNIKIQEFFANSQNCILITTSPSRETYSCTFLSELKRKQMGRRYRKMNEEYQEMKRKYKEMKIGFETMSQSMDRIEQTYG